MNSGKPIAFDAARHAAFQALMDRYGAPALVAGKQAATGNREVTTREGALGYRIATCQLKWLQAQA
jgi:hypothetical protein